MMQRSLWEVQDEAIGRSYSAAPDEWKKEARAAVIEVALEVEEFTTDEVWGKNIGLPPEPRALGGVIRTLAAERIIQNTYRVRPSERHEQNHGRALTIWRSLIWNS